MRAMFDIIDTYTYHVCLPVYSSLSYVTFQGNIEIDSHKTGGH